MEHTPGKLHPLMMVAAISVTAASLAAIGLMTGILPGKKAEVPATVATSAVPLAASGSTSAQLPVAAPATTTTAVSEPAAHAERPAARPAVVKKATGTHAVKYEPPPPPPTTSAASVPPAPPVAASPPVCRDCGTVESVREVTRKGEGSGIGAIAGGVLGGVLGHQVGSGRGKDLATVAGAVGGAVAGHQVEKYQRRTTRYDITVRMDDGTMQTITAESQPSWRAGDRVKVSNGVITPSM